MVFPRPRAVYIIPNWLFTLVILYSTNAQNITSTTLRDGQVACADTDVTFTCQTIGSTALSWRSEHFIGERDTAQLVFSFDVDSPGRTREGIDSTTVATLTRNELVNGMQLLESTLRIRAPAISSTPLSVTCVHLVNDVDMSVNFNVLSVPGVVQNASIMQVPCENSISCLVVALWYPPSNSPSANVTHYNVNVTVVGEDAFTTIRNISATSNETALSAFHVVPNCTEFDLENVTVSGVAVNQCGEGPSVSAMLLPNLSDNIGDLEDYCPAISSNPGPEPSASAATESCIGLLYGAMVLAFMKTGL